MTAGSYCHDYPWWHRVHGIVVSGGLRGRGTGGWDESAWVVTPPSPPQLTVLNAGRRYLGLQDLAARSLSPPGWAWA